ncbi:MBL fold metallo-hydrolase [Haloechinothrix sp. YIM 98757]|uniref:MBL fold metallo-hydrolase n=1 Tax=Haloechinothrix aidingensis TaxID=2752311 RepID=A0A838AAY7_9PSEU|nr:MBL fold metallo-hydrolase [Haloechinothrix aidingensis]
MTDPAMRFLGHSTVRMDLGGTTVLTDPVLTGRVGPLSRVTPNPDAGSYAGVDLVLISHLHADHLHLPSLRLLGADVRIVVPRGAGTWLRERGFRRVEELDVGGQLTERDVRVTATRAVHSGHRWGPRLTHGPQSPAIGHLLEANGLRIYLAGDTGLFDGMSSLGPVDVAALPVWGWGPTLGPGHLTPQDAAVAVGRIHPRLAVPVHWGTLAPVGLPRAPGRLGNRMRRALVEPPREFAAAVRRARTPGRVIIREPGEPVPVPDPGTGPTSDVTAGWT